MERFIFKKQSLTFYNMIKTDIALAGNAASNVRVQDRERRMSLF